MLINELSFIVIYWGEIEGNLRVINKLLWIVYSDWIYELWLIMN